jgi:serine phosphatase RsbU (regulator of sigma subunit)/anti-sigma regulatory factor (Ser/Thr protein kinase)
MRPMKAEILPGIILVLGVVAVLVANPGSVPPSTPVIAALVAAALRSFRATVGFAVIGVAASALLTRFVSDYSGSALWTRVVFQVVLGAIAVFVAWTLQRRPMIKEQTLPILHDVSNELFDAHGMDELGEAAGRLAGSLHASSTSLFVREADLLVQLPRDVETSDAVVARAAQSECPGRMLEHVIDRARPLFWGSASVLVAEIPLCAGWVDRYRVASLAAVPVHSEGVVAGVFVVSYSEAQPFDAAQRAFLEQVGVQLSRAVEKARVEEVSRSVASELQQSLLGPTVLVPQVGHCSRYLPAEEGLSVGGDWYQTVRLGDGNFGIAVGDALGHGLGAATVMGQLRSALAACALTAESPARALDVLDQYATDLPGATSTTVVYAVVNVVDRWLEYSSAGHPYPLYVSPDGEARFLEGAQGLPLCCGGSFERVTQRIPFPAGSTIILYSDGLIERRRESLAVGLERLKETVLARWRLPIEILADEIVKTLFADSARTDDVAVLVLRSPVKSHDVFLTKRPARPVELAPLRAELGEWLEQHITDRVQINAVLTTVGEAAANAIDHAYSDQRDPLMRVEATRIDDELILNVTDTGRWKSPVPTPARGRGIAMMDALADDVTIDRRPSGTSVTLRHTLRKVDDDVRPVHH